MESTIIKLYNPIVGGQAIRVETGVFDVDKTMEFEEGVAMDLKEKYPFLVNPTDEKFSPDSQSDTRSFPIEQINSGRITARLSEELKSITTGITSVLNETNSNLLNQTSLQQGLLTAMVQELQIISERLKKIEERNSKSWFKKIFK